MNRMITSVKVASGALAAVALIFGATVSGRTSSAHEGITVEAGKLMVLHHRDARAGILRKTLWLAERVDFSDIDIGTKAGEAVLHGRIAAAAASICKRLDALYPASSAPGEIAVRATCVGRAIVDATDRAEPAIVAARGAEHQ